MHIIISQSVFPNSTHYTGRFNSTL